DVLLAPGFLDRVRHNALTFKQRLAELKDRHPAVIAELRGEGFLLGLRALVPAAELVDALRAEKLLTVAAGEKVVRLVPPLTLGVAAMTAALARLDPAATPHARALAPA